MKIYKKGGTAFILKDGRIYKTNGDWDQLVNRRELYQRIQLECSGFEVVSDLDVSGPFDPPVQNQELWASGVTYLRSREARVAESKSAGGGDFYDRVYDADRPELFFKAAAHRIVGHTGRVNIRKDSTWDVPEPELTLFISSEGTIEGYTIGNDMSSRSIEGENPLYLPQAKTYDRSAALGPCLFVPEQPISMNSAVSLSIARDNVIVFEDSITLERMKRQPRDLADWLFRELSFPHGCYLMTGTGIVPPDDFTLQPEDVVTITIEGIGTLTNTIQQSTKQI
jgi:2-dehydro-3-deoxy-D-arabinonate dehydratase